MYISDTLKKALKDMLQESAYYFVLAGLHDAYLDGYDKGWKDGYVYGIKEEH